MYICVCVFMWISVDEYILWWVMCVGYVYVDRPVYTHIVYVWMRAFCVYSMVMCCVTWCGAYRHCKVTVVEWTITG